MILWLHVNDVIIKYRPNEAVQWVTWIMQRPLPSSILPWLMERPKWTKYNDWYYSGYTMRVKHRFYSKLNLSFHFIWLWLLIISIDIHICVYYRAMKEKTDCKLLHEVLHEGCSLLRFKVIQLFWNLVYRLIDMSYLQKCKK